ncbi:MAG: MBL fold metallo-hydrolase [Candidatus Thermoplasmatota archaeon]|nr:MBL fold metallo-hydrolase [Candidatus Thermoplasmatota archaeon]
MLSLKVLVDGYAKKIKHGWEGNSTATLLQNDDKHILVDPGLDDEILQKALKKEGLGKENTDYIFITHYHLDHILNIKLFSKAIIADGYYIYRGNKAIEHDGKPFGKNIEIMHTPGHTLEHSSLIVYAPKATYAVAGDLIWWPPEKGKDLIHLPDPFAYDMKDLVESRKKLLQKADFIIPGHGKMFKME